MTIKNNLNNFEKLESKTIDNLSRPVDELLCIGGFFKIDLGVCGKVTG